MTSRRRSSPGQSKRSSHMHPHGTELSEARVFPRVHRAQKMHSQFRVLEYIRMRYYRLMGLKAPEALDSINDTPNDEKGSRDLVMLPREQNTIDGLVGQWLLNLALESDEDETEADGFSINELSISAMAENTRRGRHGTGRTRCLRLLITLSNHCL